MSRAFGRHSSWRAGLRRVRDTRTRFFGEASVTPWRVLAGFLIAVFVLGGASRGDVASLIILRPLAVVVCGWAFLQLDADTLRRGRALLVVAGAMFAVVALHLLPLPQPLWQILPGHALDAEIGNAAGLGSQWRPLSVSPSDTWNALFSLFVPLAVLLLILAIGPDQHRNLARLLLYCGLGSAALGALQALTPGNAALHFYRIESVSGANGLFANRNHQALLLVSLMPLAAVVFGTGARPAWQRSGMTIGLLVAIVPILLVTGSRAGLVLGVLAVFSIPLLWPRLTRERRAPAWQRWLGYRWSPVVVAFIALAGVVLLSQRAEAFSRLFESKGIDEHRLEVLPAIATASVDFMPLGSGIGSFVRAYQVYEPFELLRPTYLNHAHNDYFELALTGGIPALAVLAAVAVLWVRQSARWLRRSPASYDVRLGRLGSALILLVALASAVDYPLHVPSIMCIATIAIAWLCYGDGRPRPSGIPAAGSSGAPLPVRALGA